MSYKDKLIEKLQTLKNEELVELWNNFCEVNKWFEDKIYDNDECFIDTFYHDDCVQLVKDIDGNTYHWKDKYVAFDNQLGGIKSTNNPKDFVCFSDLANWLLQENNEWIVKKLYGEEE